jgi:hypothetical protein
MPVANLESEIYDAEPETAQGAGALSPYSAAVPAEGPSEIAGFARPHLYSVEASTESAAAGPVEQEPSSTSAAEPSPEGGVSVAAAPPAEPEHRIEPVSEKPLSPRRGWWQAANAAIRRLGG